MENLEKCTSAKKKMEKKFPEFSRLGGRALSFGIFFCLHRVFKRIEMQGFRLGT